MINLLVEDVNSVGGGADCICQKFVPFSTNARVGMFQSDVRSTPEHYNQMWKGAFDRKSECKEKCCEELGATHYSYGAVVHEKCM